MKVIFLRRSSFMVGVLLVRIQELKEKKSDLWCSVFGECFWNKSCCVKRNVGGSKEFQGL